MDLNNTRYRSLRSGIWEGCQTNWMSRCGVICGKEFGIIWFDADRGFFFL